MKKSLKSILFGYVAILYLLMTLTACGKKTTPGQNAVNEMTSAMEEITSVRMSLVVDLTPVGESAIALKSDIEQLKEPMNYHVVLNVERAKKSSNQELYVVKHEEETYAYMKKKSNWFVFEQEETEEDIGNTILLKSGSDWEVTEEKEVDGVQCTVLTGCIPNKNILHVVEASGVVMPSFNEDVDGHITLYQDMETKLPHALIIDFGMLESMDSFYIQCFYNGFNDFESITLPEEVKNATPM